MSRIQINDEFVFSVTLEKSFLFLKYLINYLEHNGGKFRNMRAGGSKHESICRFNVVF